MKKLSFTTQIIIASIIGVIVGLIFGKNTIYIKFLGDIFINLINLMVPFLIFGAILAAVMTLEFKDFGSIGIKTLLSFATTSLIAGFIGLLFVTIGQPGAGMNVQLSEYDGNATGMTLYEAIMSFFPRNIFVSLTNNSIIQVIVFAIIIGLTISYYKENESIKRVYNGVLDFNELTMKVITLIMKTAPIGIFAIVASMLGQNGVEVLLPLLKFIFWVTLANVTVFVIMGLLVSAIGRISYFRLLKNVKRSIIIAATTTSSAMSLPMKLLDSEENLGISKRISNFVNPLGGSLNTDGGVILTTMASITMTQIMGIDLSPQAMITLVLYSVLSSFGNTMVPGGGIVAMAIVFSLNGIPLEGVALFAGIDWILAITRVVLNVVDDMFCALFVAITEKEFDKEVFYGRKTVVSNKEI